MSDQEEPVNVFEGTTGHKPKPSIQSLLIGKPLPTAEAGEQTIGKFVGLAVFSSDAMSSVAYGPQELMMILAAAGAGAIPLSLPLVFAIVGLLTVLTFSYEQTIHTYPDGGGAYIVARDNLGELPAQIAGAALLTDYILTVSVSISSGVAQLVSAYPSIYPYRVSFAVAMILLIMLINLRGVKESGTAFAIPTYFFLLMMIVTIVTGFIRFFNGSLGAVIDPPTMEAHVLQPLTVFLVLKAFANGTASVTGVEAISNGITAFKEPRSSNAGKTLIWMAAIMAFLLVSITFLSNKIGAVPVEGETVISQLFRTIYEGRGLLYILSISATTIILIMAANTAFAGFPRLGALQAADGFLPRQLTYRGSRLVFTSGIVALAVFSSLLVVVFQASVSKLIPLYAIGVFLSFTLSQTGMARRWWKSGHLKPGEKIDEVGSTVYHDKGWLYKMIVNGFGAIMTFTVMIIFAVTKFSDGAWVVIILVPALVMGFFSIRRHYKRLAAKLSLENRSTQKRISRNRVIMPVSGIHSGTLDALNYAATLSDDITVVHISTDPAETAKLKAKWEVYGEGYRLVVLNSPYRLFLEPLLSYIDNLAEIQTPNEIITIVVPQFVSKGWWTSFLHMRTAETLRKALLNRKNIVITEVPYQV